ncbi:MAG: tyrosine-type recombinase/integrase [Planctomycetes bacterium]|nr:tyrosine-type recombinase/integrase [Planctomycetota bacterium]
MPRPEYVVVMLRGDLEAASIPYRDDSGRVTDFHSLRGTFASLLLRAGVDVRTAKDLMRHSTIAMTADVYACTMRGSQNEAVKRLPSLATAGREKARATGTYDVNNVLPDCLPDLHAATCIPLHRVASSVLSGDTSDNPINTGVFDESRCVAMQENAARPNPQKPPPRGIEPLLPDTQVVKSQALTSSSQSVLPVCLPDSAQNVPDLAVVVKAWPKLPEPVRAGIVAMVRTVSDGPTA